MNPDYDVNKFQLPKIKGKPWNKVSLYIYLDLSIELVFRIRIYWFNEKYFML
jgi:hypothetical protein